MLEKLNAQDYEIEVVEVSLNQCEYELKIAHLVKVLLEIDELMEQPHDQSLSKESEAA